MEINKIHQMDCLEGMKQLDSKSVNCIITDPPYNINKASWDNISGYVDWMMEFFKECERVLMENGTLWFFHMRFPVLAELQMRIEAETGLRHKQLIIIDKGIQSIAGRAGKSLRSYPRATEYLQFYCFDDHTGAQQLGEQYARVNPMAKYLSEEFERAGVTRKEIAALFPSRTGGLTGCVSNWLMGLNFPLREQYEKMRHYLNKAKEYEYLRKEYEYLRKEYEDLRKEYEDLRKEYEDLRKEYEDLRYPFNMESGVTDVWKISFYEDEKIAHVSPKPMKLMRRIVQTATKEGDLVLEPFAGSGSTLVACKESGRNFIAFERESEYIEIAEGRLKQKTLCEVN